MPFKILIVDDEEAMRAMVGELLIANGYHISKASDAIEALKKLKEEKPNLILLDIVMPDINGYQFCELLRKDPEYKDIPIIILTARSQKRDIFWAFEKGAKACITKPFEPNHLLGIIRQVLQGSASTAESPPPV